MLEATPIRPTEADRALADQRLAELQRDWSLGLIENPVNEQLQKTRKILMEQLIETFRLFPGID